MIESPNAGLGLLNGHIRDIVSSDQILLLSMGYDWLRMPPLPKNFQLDGSFSLFVNEGQSSYAIQSLRDRAAHNGHSPFSAYRLDFCRIPLLGTPVDFSKLGILDVGGIPTVRSATLTIVSIPENKSESEKPKLLLVATRLPYGSGVKMDPSTPYEELRGLWEQIVRERSSELNNVGYPEPI